jgi:glycosyltransferase involved in cell wall biosynthesis
MRRVLARRKLATCGSVWPINELAGRTPEGWPEWPDDKKFAVVLTHDVEGPLGLAKCRQLAELEMEMGFRSSFNFVPEGSYTVPPSLITWLTDNGFEVGVHDLEHNGKLFQSRRGFLRKAARINNHIRDWGASGFRSGFMLRNLDWLHALNIEYDASTFDTDPFEPQSEGAGTIFPFWITAPEGSQSGGHLIDKHPGSSPELSPSAKGPKGYLELPYTLPQDSTLFLVLKETSPAIWLRKLDWIASRGGMALVNVHPDYLRFDGEPAGKRIYTIDFYRELLRHIRQRYPGEYWQPLPRKLTEELAGRLRPLEPSASARANEGSERTAPFGKIASLRGKKVAVLLYSYYPSDPRPRRAAEAMIGAGMELDLLCLSETERESRNELVGGVHVTRLPMRHLRGSKWAYFWQYGRFFLSAFWFLFRNGMRKKYDIVHVHNMPDFLVFAALVPKLRGARVILDLHDPMPELMESIYKLPANDWKVHFLCLLERWSIGFSDLALTPNVTFKNLFVSRSCLPEKIHVVMNSPQQEIFGPERYPPGKYPVNVAAEFRVMHHGSIVHRHGVDLLVEAVAQLRPKIPGIQLHIYGTSTSFLKAILALAGRLGIADIVFYHGAKTQVEIAEAILSCHVGVVPNRRSAFIEINFPTRIFEYLAMLRPVIVPDTRGIRDYFDPKQILFFETNNVDDLGARIHWVWSHPTETAEAVRAGNEIYQKHLWQNQKNDFLGIVSTLCV